MSPRAPVRLLALAVLAFACAACSAQHARATADTLVFGRNTDVVTLDPAVAFDGISLTTSRAIYEGLTRYKPGTFEVEPSLATS